MSSEDTFDSCLDLEGIDNTVNASTYRVFITCGHCGTELFADMNLDNKGH